MNKIRHQATSRDSLYEDISRNLETIFSLWKAGDKSLRFTIPILCAAKLEAFINVAGKLKVKHWDILERKLSFNEKCQIVFSSACLTFDSSSEPNKTAIAIFEIRNSLVHPKMKLKEIDEFITQDEYQLRSGSYIGELHQLRSELKPEKVITLKNACDQFVTDWGNKLLDDAPEYWLSGGSTGTFT